MNIFIKLNYEANYVYIIKFNYKNKLCIYVSNSIIKINYIYQTEISK